MNVDLYQDVILTVDLPEHSLCAGDVGALVERHAVPGKEVGYSALVFRHDRPNRGGRLFASQSLACTDCRRSPCCPHPGRSRGLMTTKMRRMEMIPKISLPSGAAPVTLNSR